MIDNKNYHPVLIVSKSALNKSNVFFSLYFLKILNMKGRTITHVYETIDDALRDMAEIVPSGKRCLIIFCDDFSYSGKQLADHINSPYKNKKVERNDNIKYYLNIIGWTFGAKNRIISEFEKSEDSLIIGTNSISISEKASENSVLHFVENYLVDKFGPVMFKEYGSKLFHLIDCYSLTYDYDKIIFSSLFGSQFISHSKDTSLIYLFNKYPDETSTINNLCRIIGAIPKTSTLNVENFVKIFEINEIQFVECFNSDLLIFIKNMCKIKGVPHVDSAAKTYMYQILGAFKGGNQNMLSWIDICDEVRGDYIIKNEYGNWIKTINNADYKDGAVDYENYNGQCYDHVIKSFYKGIQYKKKNKISQIQMVDNTKSLLQISQTGGKKITGHSDGKYYYEKYIKYVNKIKLM